MQPVSAKTDHSKAGLASALRILRPAPLLVQCRTTLQDAYSTAPVLDLACGAGYNGLYLAVHGASVRLIDRDESHLAAVRALSHKLGVSVDVQWMDLERGEPPLLPYSTYGVVLVFRYLHRPLIPSIQKTIKPGGILVYETFTTDQLRFGRPRNPDYLLKPGELHHWFKEWEILHAFEGELQNPLRAMAQIVCRKP